MNILVVEDNQICNTILCRMISQVGYEADSCGCAYDAIKMASQKNYDIVFTDIQLPDLNGLYLSRFITSKTNAPIVIGVSASQCKYCSNSGMLKCIEKPIRLSDVKEIINEYHNK